MQFEKNLDKKQTWSIFYKNNIFPYTVKYLWETENWNNFEIKIPGYKKEILEKDLEQFFHKTVYTLIDNFLENEEKKKEKISIPVRYFIKDIEFLKEYAEKNNMKYQTIMRNCICDYCDNLKKNQD